MRKSQKLVLISLCLLLSSYVATFRAETPPPRPIELADIMAWRSIGPTALSEQGEWFAYRFGPLEGDSDVIIRQTKGDKEYKFSVGELPAPTIAQPGDSTPPQSAGPAVAFSRDGKFAAYTIYPSRREAAQLKRQRRPLQNKIGIVNLATGEKMEILKVRRFTFSGENPGWIAMHKYGAEAPSGAGGGPPSASGPSPGAPSGSQREDRPRGSDLLLRELATGQEINIGNVGDFVFDKHGRWLAWTIDAQDKAGNGVQLREMTSGVVRSIEADGKANYTRLAWSEEGDGLTVLKGVEDKAYEDKLHSVIAFKDFGADAPRKTVFNPSDSSDFPAGMTVSSNRSAIWTKDLNGLLFGIQKAKRKDRDKLKETIDESSKTDRPAEKTDAPKPDDKTDPPRADDQPQAADDKPDLVIWHWQDRRLQSQQQVQENADKTFSYLALYRPAEKKFIRLADDDVRQVTPARDHKFGIGFSNAPYEMMGNLDGRRYQDVYVIDLRTGERKLALKKSRWTMGISPTGTQFLYYDDGHYYTYDMTRGQATNITKDVPTSFINTENDTNVIKPPTPSIGWSQDGKHVLLSDMWDVWKIPVAGGAGTNLTVNGRQEQIRYRNLVELDPEEPGYDLSKPVYTHLYSEWTKKSGIGVIDPSRPGVKRLLWDDVGYSIAMKARKADVFLYTRQTYKDPPDYFVSDESLGNGTKITSHGTAQEQFLWSSGSMLIDYVSAKGDKLQAALHLPAGYEKGRSYPTIVYIYERMSQSLNQYSRPTANGFNKSVYTSQGYAVLQPDITYKINDPGMSAVWCVLPALKAAIATGVVDKGRVGLHGHSWGGYQTAFLVTQTDAFAAAVAGAPLTNMISMYSLIYKNTGGTNGAIFESSQGRFTGGPWENWEAYTRNSPVAHARNVKTPLVILHNDRDGAVDFTQGVEYYNTLRRLQKPVVLLQYPGENHGLVKRPNQKDYTVRMKEFFDHHLKGKPKPEWFDKGVPRLDMEEHLKGRSPIKTAPVTTTQSGSKQGG